jgi:hypothetical protein
VAGAGWIVIKVCIIMVDGPVAVAVTPYAVIVVAWLT